MTTGLILLAGGTGTRMGKPVPKQFLLLGGRPIIMHTLERIERISGIDEVVITCPASHLEHTRELLSRRSFADRFRCIEGGTTRQGSVANGLDALQGCDRIVIHEAVRPFVTTEEFERLLAEPEPNAFYGAPISYTVLGGKDYVEVNYERDSLVNVQLPQKFDAQTLREAHRRATADGRVFTEDASMVFAYDLAPVRILPGSSYNLKITNPSDLLVGEAIYEEFFVGRRQDS
jgi:2-C-methyl-D-erythritol 4-phosphate cytidylyltransferase